ncbi:MAG TPA: extracellular solute-binding protein [Candidatus Enterocloster faecavium]|uniref:Extracellular solute-binding protein n=1 Tax=Candidatus Enterocloster faecavium TaxID=2838560 RepID=A0A9D2L998_9FIRM|nr:extracellular solute-binding protein [Candidatus Enterocloster faecavium]
MKKLFKKTAALTAAAALTAGLALTGCGSSSTGTSGQTSAAADGSAAQEGGETAGEGGGTLRVTMALSEEEWEVMRNEVIPGFEEQYGVTVQADQIEAADVVKQIQAMNQAGDMQIDVIAQDANNLTSLVYDGLVEDLSEYQDLIPEEAMGSLAEAGVFDGKTYFMPYRPNAEINYYNTDMFEKYGLTPPATWDELYETAKTLKEQEGIGRLCLKMKMDGDAIELVEFIRGAGGDPLVLNDEGSIEAFTFLQKLWPELSEDTMTASFSSTNTYLATDEVYYAPNWPFSANILVQDGGKTNISATEGYAGPEGFVKTLGGEMLGIPVGSKNKEMAINFIQYMESKEVQTTLMKENGWMSFRSDVYGEADEWQKPFLEATQKAMEVAEPLPHVSYWPEAQQAINDAAKEICINGADVKETLDKYAAQIADYAEKAGY